VKRLNACCSLLLTWLCTTSQSFQSALDPEGPQAAIIENIWWIFLVVLGLVYVIVMLLLGKGLWNSRKKDQGEIEFPVPVPDAVEPIESEDEIRVKRNVTIGLGITAIILIALTITSYTAERSLLSHNIKDLLIIEVYGNQWWWDFRYVDSIASRRVKTAPHSGRSSSDDPRQIERCDTQLLASEFERQERSDPWTDLRDDHLGGQARALPWAMRGVLWSSACAHGLLGRS
jgi:heme/copper-type cytochrome/quinol oxidase subunit 2